ADIAATLLYPVTDRPFRELYEMTCGWSAAQRAEVIDVALGSRTRRDEILAGFRGGLYAYDFVMDIGAFRDLHRHRRCQKFRQAYSGNLGFDTPTLVTECGASDIYAAAMQAALHAMRRPRAGGVRNPAYTSTFVFDNDFAALKPDTPVDRFDQDGLLQAESEPGICRVVCFSPQHNLTIANMEPGDLRIVVDTWVDQYVEL